MKQKIVKLIVVLSCFLCFLYIGNNQVKLASAEEVKTYVAMIDNTPYEDLKLAVDSAVEGDKITIINDYTIDIKSNATAYITVSNKSITIDLNGKSIFVNVDCSLTAFIMTSDSAHLNILDSSTEKTGLIEINTISGSISNFVRNSNDCSITINSGNYKMDKSVNGAGMIDSRCDTSTTSKVGVYINGGNFYLGNVGTLENGSPWMINTSGQNEKGVLVAGGTFNSNVNKQFYPFEVDISNDLALKDNGDGTWTTVPAVCYVNVRHKSGIWYNRSEGFATFAEGFEKVYAEKVDVQNGYGSVLCIIKDCYTTKDNFIVPTDRPIIIDLYANIFLEDGYEIPGNTTINLCEPESSVSVYVPEPNEPDETPNDQPTGNSEGLSIGVIIGIFSAPIVIIGGGIAIHFYVVKKKLHKNKTNVTKIQEKTKIKKNKKDIV